MRVDIYWKWISSFTYHFTRINNLTINTKVWLKDICRWRKVDNIVTMTWRIISINSNIFPFHSGYWISKLHVFYGFTNIIRVALHGHFVWNRILCCSSINLVWCVVWAMLWFVRFHMFKFQNYFFNVPQHGYIHSSCFVVSIKGAATVYFSLPIFWNFIVFLDGVDYVPVMFFPYIFNPKIIHDQCELNRSCNVPPKSWCVGEFVVFLWSKEFLEL